MQDVKEIGRRSFFKSLTGFFLGSVVTSASFQTLGSNSGGVQDYGNECARGSVYSIRNQFGIASGPHAFAGFSLPNTL